MTMLRILAVTNMYPTPRTPSSGIFIEQQVGGLRRAGVDVDVLFFDRLAEGRRVYDRVPARLREAVAARRPDLVHAMYGGVMADRVTRTRADVPVVVTYHGSDLQGAGGAGPIDRLSAAYGVRCSKRAARRASGVVVVSAHLARHLPGGFAAGNVRVIPSGIDLERFRPLDRARCRQQLGWQDGRFHVVFATNNDDPVKRPELARETVRRLTARGCPADLHILRGVSNREVPVWLNAADVLLLTSLQEGSPTIVKEAMACDRPVVSVDVGDVASQLDGIEGCFVADADPDALALALERVRTGPGRAATRGRAAEASLEATTARLLAFYESVLEARARLGRRVSRRSVGGQTDSASEVS